MLVKMKTVANVGVNNHQIFALTEGEIYDLPEMQAQRFLQSGVATLPEKSDMEKVVEEANLIAQKEIESKAPVTQIPSTGFSAPSEPSKEPPVPVETPTETKAREKASRVFSNEDKPAQKE